MVKVCGEKWQYGKGFDYDVVLLQKLPYLIDKVLHYYVFLLEFTLLVMYCILLRGGGFYNLFCRKLFGLLDLRFNG